MRLKKTIQYDFEFSQEIGLDDIIKILKVPRVSAEELLDGTIAFQEDELAKIAKRKDITMDDLVQHMKVQK